MNYEGPKVPNLLPIVVMMGQGLALLALQDGPTAARIFRQVLAMDPGDAEARNSFKRAKGE
jgi:hypothetical protein